MNGLISVIVPIYNVAEYLPKCIESILSQTYEDIEVILVNDGSKDRSGEICDTYAKSDTRVRVVHKENGGLSSARNAGIEAARGEYIGFVDGDDYIDTDMYEQLMTGMHIEGVKVSCCALYKDGINSTRIIGNADGPKLFTAEQAIMEVILNGEINVSVCCKLFKRNIFKSLRFPLGKLNEDEAIVIQTLSTGDVYHTGEAKYHYLYRENSITNQYGLKGAQALYHNMRIVAKQVEKDFPNLSSEIDRYKAKKAFDVLMIYNVSKLKKDSLYKEASRTYKDLWKKTYSNAKGKKERIFYILERFGLLRILFRFLK